MPSQAAPPGAGRRALHALLGIFWNGSQGRVRATWRLAGLIATLIASARLVGASGLLPEPGSQAALLARTLLNAVVALAAVALVGRLLDRRRLREFGLALDREWFADLGFGLLLGAALMSAIFAIEWGAGWLRISETFRSATPHEPFARAMLVPVLAFVGVGVFEELLARGYLLRNLAEGLAFPRLGGAEGGLVLAVLLSSTVFALGHAHNPNASWVSTLSIGLAGGVLALGYLLTGQLAIPIGLHITWNLFQGAVFGFPVSGWTRIRTTVIAIEQTGPDHWTGGAFGPEAGLLGLAALLAAAVAIPCWVRWRRGRVALATGLAAPPARRPPATAA